MIREPGWRFRNPELATHLADFEPDVAAAALSRADLTSEDWTALIPRLPVRARGFLRLRKDLPETADTLLDRLGVHDRGLPSPPEVTSEERVGETPPAVTGFEDEKPRFVPPRPIDIRAARADGPSNEEPANDEFEQSASNREPIDDNSAPPFDFATPQTPFIELPTEDPASELIESGEDSSTSASQDTTIDPASAGRSEISALVERIAQYKRNQDTDGAGGSLSQGEFDSNEPRLPLGEEQLRQVTRSRAFGFAADAGGRIEWSDGDVASMIIGTRLVAPAPMGGSAHESPLERAFRQRQPILGAPKQLIGAEAIQGDWIVDAQPRFTQQGNFAGYVGRFRRPAEVKDSTLTAAEREADRIRQLLHELRTPVTAVQGYAEVIQQQLFGAAPHEYRALAAAIAGDAARILAGFEELDRLAKLETGVLDIDGGETDLASLAERTCRQLEPVLRPRMAGIALEGAKFPCIIPVDTDQAEALLWRLLATLGGGCAAGEMLAAEIGTTGLNAQLRCEIPAQLLSEEDVFAAEAKPASSAINAGIFGAGFALRLARAEAKAAGGDLIRDDDTLILTLPLFDEASEFGDPDYGSKPDAH